MLRTAAFRSCRAGLRIAPAARLNGRAGVTAAAAATDRAERGDIATVHYTGFLDNGEMFDTSRQDGRSPLEFTIGAGNVIVGFDKAVSGLAVGEKRTLRVEPKDAYGEYSDEMTMKFSKAQAPEGLEVGMQVQLSNGLLAKIAAVDEKEVTLDVNPPLAGEHLTFDVELMSLVKGGALSVATFAAGCFWGPELAFQRVPGVYKTEVGYSNGAAENPTYEQVCSGTTGHAEVVQVSYKEGEVSYETLLDTFWANLKDPTQVNGQGADSGTQYRTGIYCHTPEQRAAATASLEAMQKKYGGAVATEICDVENYSRAEEYHQQYLSRGGRNGQAQSPAKGCSDPIRCYG